MRFKVWILSMNDLVEVEADAVMVEACGALRFTRGGKPYRIIPHGQWVDCERVDEEPKG